MDLLGVKLEGTTVRPVEEFTARQLTEEDLQLLAKAVESKSIKHLQHSCVFIPLAGRSVPVHVGDWLVQGAGKTEALTDKIFHKRFII